MGLDLLDDLRADAKTGLSELIGSWKIIAISLPRTFRRSSSVAPISSVPPSIARPVISALGPRVSPIRLIAVTDLPQPDSPTIARTSPRRTSNETPSTALTWPSSVWKRTRRSSTVRSGALAHAWLVPESSLIRGSSAA